MAVLPTKGNLIAQKRSRKLAENGFELMDKKRNILIRELMALIEQAKYIQDQMDTLFAGAYAALRHANIAYGDCNKYAHSVAVDDSINVQFRSVMGVELPIVSVRAELAAEPPYGVSNTGARLDAAYHEFFRVKQLIGSLAQTENAIFRLAYAIKKTQKRANALKNIVIPNLDESIRKISDELEEKEREEFVRQKVIKATKR